jgi:tripartite-type tricarboxylate transporter receptor subunit TctC
VKLQRGRIAVAASVLLAAAFAAQAADRQAYPTRPIRLIISSVPGSAPDTVGRLLGAALTETWGQQIVVDNRAGATGLIAAETVARAAPDGYTLWLNTMTQLISTLQAKRYMLASDFQPVSLVASTPFVIVVAASLPVKSLADWIAYAKARPGQLNYGSAGQWGSSHLCIESINTIGGLSVVHVPYKGSTQVLSDMAAGRIQIYCPAAPSLPAIAQAGRVRAIAMTYQKPTPLAPDLPAVSDTLPGFELLGWYGLQVPLHTPKDLVARINADIVKVLKTPELKEKLFAVGAEAVGSSPERLAQFLRSETTRWDKVLREGGTIPGRKGEG